MERGLCAVIIVGGSTAQHMDDLLLALMGVIAQRAAGTQHQFGDQLERALILSGIQHPDDLHRAGAALHVLIELGNYPVIRIMPNTPAAIGEGMILYCAEGVETEEKTAFVDVMQAAGSFDELSESLIDAGSAVSGCGPAFVYPFIEAMADGAVACGLPRAKAQRYAAQTLVGAAKLVLESGDHPGALKDAVCSPGGSTIQGVRALEQNGFRSAVVEAVIAAYEKTVALGKQ